MVSRISVIENMFRASKSRKSTVGSRIGLIEVKIRAMESISSLLRAGSITKESGYGLLKAGSAPLRLGPIRSRPDQSF